jgi:tRNA modification GTPase
MAPNDTIAAIATPPGIGGIAIIRLSGGNSLDVIQHIFRGKHAPGDIGTHRVIHGSIVDPEGGGEIDEVLVTVMLAPHSYTGEHVIEISCHGGVVPAHRVLEACLASGARMAERGEFTRRAFLNGRIDLTQAEAILDLITAKTKEGLKNALFQRNGMFSNKVQQLKEALLATMRGLELSLDFAHEDIAVPANEAARDSIIEAIELIDVMVVAGKRAIVLREGVSAAIVGKPNVGKSSLLNALLLEERAIVTPLPGTTRDIIEGWINIQGIPIRLYDTCGFHDAGNVVEKKGMEKTEEAIAETTFVLFVTDGSEAVTPQDRKIFGRARGKPLIIVINKSDLPQVINISDMLNGKTFPVCRISAKEHTGVEQLNNAILTLMGMEHNLFDEGMPTRSRHLMLLLRARESLEKARKDIGERKTPELVVVNIKDALTALAEIIGEVTPEGVLDAIFQEFCIGK